jgi:hypothetical protein
MYPIKLLDTILQAVAFMTGIILLLIFGTTGYLYWILLGLSAWIVLSSLLHIVSRQKIGSFRIVVWSIYALLALSAGIYIASGGKVAKVNFFFWPFSILILIMYFILSIIELQSIQTRGKEDLDF